MKAITIAAGLLILQLGLLLYFVEINISGHEPNIYFKIIPHLLIVTGCYLFGTAKRKRSFLTPSQLVDSCQGRLKTIRGFIWSCSTAKGV